MALEIFGDYFCGGVEMNLRGHIVRDSMTIQKDGSTTKLGYCVYLPPNYNNNKGEEEGSSSQKKKEYPILYHLHGAAEFFFMMKNEVSWIAKQLEQVNEEMIIAAPHDATKFSMWADGSNVDIANQFVNHFIPYIEKRYCNSSTKIPRSCRFLQGFSMGGFGAAVIGFKHQGMFAKLIIWDGALHDWGTLSTSRAFIAKSQFDCDELKFTPWCPYDTVGNSKDMQTTPILVYNGNTSATSSFAKKFVKLLDKKGATYECCNNSSFQRSSQANDAMNLLWCS